MERIVYIRCNFCKKFSIKIIGQLTNDFVCAEHLTSHLMALLVLLSWHLEMDINQISKSQQKISIHSSQDK